MLIGVVSSNCLQAIAANHSLKNAPSSILNAESVLSGLFLLSLLGLHGSNFMQLRATNDLKRKCSKFSLKYCFSSMACLICMTFLNGNTIHFDFAEFSTTSLVGLMIMISALGTMYWSIWKQKRVCIIINSNCIICTGIRGKHLSKSNDCGLGAKWKHYNFRFNVKPVNTSKNAAVCCNWYAFCFCIYLHELPHFLEAVIIQLGDI